MVRDLPQDQRQELYARAIRLNDDAKMFRQRIRQYALEAECFHERGDHVAADVRGGWVNHQQYQLDCNQTSTLRHAKEIRNLAPPLPVACDCVTF